MGLQRLPEYKIEMDQGFFSAATAYYVFTYRGQTMNQIIAITAADMELIEPSDADVLMICDGKAIQIYTAWAQGIDDNPVAIEIKVSDPVVLVSDPAPEATADTAPAPDQSQDQSK